MSELNPWGWSEGVYMTGNIGVGDDTRDCDLLDAERLSARNPLDSGFCCTMCVFVSG